jgi:hypothetical protein
MTRTCGSCQLCCKLLPMVGGRARHLKSLRAAEAMIDAGMARPDEFFGMVAEFEKPANARCPKQKHGKGCSIYEKRPFCCRTWSCRWLMGQDTEGLQRPDRTHVVIDCLPDYVTAVDNDTGTVTKVPVLQVWVDPDFPEAHRDPHLRAYLAQRGEQEGMAAIIRFGPVEGFVLFPPALAADGQWHEQTGEKEPEHAPMPVKIEFEARE